MWTTAGSLLGAYVLYLLGGLTLLGSLIWNPVLILAGYFLGKNWQLVEEYAGALQMLVAAGVAGLVTLFVAKKLRKRRERVTV